MNIFRADFVKRLTIQDFRLVMRKTLFVFLALQMLVLGKTGLPFTNGPMIPYCDGSRPVTGTDCVEAEDTCEGGPSKTPVECSGQVITPVPRVVCESDGNGDQDMCQPRNSEVVCATIGGCGMTSQTILRVTRYWCNAASFVGPPSPYETSTLRSSVGCLPRLNG